MDRREKKKLRRSQVLHKLIHLGKVKMSRQKLGGLEKGKNVNRGPLIRRILINSAHMLASCSTSSLQNSILPKEERITVNVGGTKYKLAKKNLEKFPDTLLGSERKNFFYDAEREEYFFDRDPLIFKNIASFYRHGSFHAPAPTVCCMEAVLDELKYFGIPQHSVFDCCCEHITQEDEEQEKKKKIETMESKVSQKTCDLRTTREKLWELLTNSKSSKESKAFGFLFGAVVLLNISAIVAETVPTESGQNHGEAHRNIFLGLDSFCVGIFTIEFTARLYAAPHRLDFVRDPSNIIDFLGIIPYYIAVVECAVKSNNPVLGFVVTVFRMFRVFRVTKLARHSERFQNLLRSLQGAATELGGILFSFLALMITFSTIMYYFEKNENPCFKSIPEAFWYTLVTMTTLGYGDIFPLTVSGKLLGAVCALMGVLLLSLPVPIIQRQLHECKRKGKPKKEFITERLMASLPSLGRIGSSDDKTLARKGGKNKNKPRTRRKNDFHDSRATSLNVETGTSSSRFGDSNTSSSNSGSEDFLVRVDMPTIKEPETSDFNGNSNVITPSTDAPQKRKSWFGNGNVSASVGDGIFTESPPSSQYFPVLRRLISSHEDGIGRSTRYKSSIDDKEDDKEAIPMKLLRQQKFPV
ncbi:potassium voltage-gated channel protein Shal-like [Stylophora pistillata]|uniref:Potassium voltage-gated channel protein Shal n=1 Tax=Stylophora pistillata TaxID=50429 RepID=A0A2B4SAY7_STYPI|nr:potassium voltage-gated channel protein Shal-like [Stylophora pistillata]PFX25702.1 Potassium voltage-gated channel protein Shal [Stylophora pistillata]